jgi:hypothetical protein
MFSIGKIHFALSHNEDSPRPDVKVCASRDQTDLDAALDVLLEALGIGRSSVAARRLANPVTLCDVHDVFFRGRQRADQEALPRILWSR